MRHQKKKTLKKKQRGGDWIPKALQRTMGYTVDEGIVAAPTVAEQTLGDIVKPLGGVPENTGVPGGMPASAPAASVLGGRRRSKRRKSRKQKKKGGVGETTSCKIECPQGGEHSFGEWKKLGDVKQRQCSKCKCIEEV